MPALFLSDELNAFQGDIIDGSLFLNWETMLFFYYFKHFVPSRNAHLPLGPYQIVKCSRRISLREGYFISIFPRLSQLICIVVHTYKRIYIKLEVVAIDLWTEVSGKDLCCHRNDIRSMMETSRQEACVCVSDSSAI